MSTSRLSIKPDDITTAVTQGVPSESRGARVRRSLALLAVFTIVIPAGVLQLFSEHPDSRPHLALISLLAALGFALIGRHRSRIRRELLLQLLALEHPLGQQAGHPFLEPALSRRHGRILSTHRRLVLNEAVVIPSLIAMTGLVHLVTWVQSASYSGTTLPALSLVGLALFCVIAIELIELKRMRRILDDGYRPGAT